VTRPTIDVKRIGDEQQPVVVIDHCLADPAAWRARATEASYDVPGEFYPGIRASVPPAYFAEFGPTVGAVLKRVFGFTQKAHFDRAYFSIVTTPSDRLTLAQRIPHIDGISDGLMAVLHYLSIGDQGGTAFYRHRSTGFETVDAARHSAYLGALNTDFARHGKPKAAYIDGDTTLFARTACFAGIFNRALIYRSSMLHCSATSRQSGFKGDPKHGRLTIAGFISAQ
jgi:hypothetical protein